MATKDKNLHLKVLNLYLNMNLTKAVQSLVDVERLSSSYMYFSETMTFHHNTILTCMNSSDEANMDKNKLTITSDFFTCSYHPGESVTQYYW